MPTAGPNVLEEAQTATCSDNLAFSALARKQAEAREAAKWKAESKSIFASDPDLALIKFNYEERIKNAL